MDKPLVDRQLTLTELQLVLRAQIHSRRELIKDMVGKLYPQIVQAEIDKLERALREIEEVEI